MHVYQHNKSQDTCTYKKGILVTFTRYPPATQREGSRMDDRERKYEISVLDLPQFQGGRGWGGGTYNQFTSASEAIVFLANPEPLPLLLCADGLYVPREPGTFPLKLPLCGEGGVWGLIC